MLTGTDLTPAERVLQQEVRAYLDARLLEGAYPVSLGMPGVVDRAFSRDLGRAGWLGLALSTEHGGQGRSAVERLLVAEELLARGAPVAYHWVAERQSGPSIARHGTEEQKHDLLPLIARGELCFAIGMSEPDAGSDLAAVSARARRDGDGWVVDGTKIWTSLAAHATHLIALLRTGEGRDGLTQFIVPTDTPGISVSPIDFIDGTRDFCEVAFESVALPDSHRLGELGGGWGQNTAELALERGGVDRWMSMVPVLDRWAREVEDDPRARADLGRLTARLTGLRATSLAIARRIDQGGTPTVEAAMFKELGTRFEQETVEVLVRHLGREPVLDADDETEALLARAVLVAPSWTIRGGTSEVLRGIVAKGLATR